VKRKKNTPEQIVTKLRQAQVEIGKGATVDQVSRKLGITEQTYYRWKREYGGMEVNQLAKLKDLERENGRLKKIVAEQAMDIDALKEIASKKW
jgi:putative transposase